MNKSLFSSDKEDWGTPKEFYDLLDQEFNFTLDPCASEANAKCETYFTKDDDGLKKDWEGHVVFCNPPYGRSITDWVRKSVDESRRNGVKVVMLIPARTDTKYWHDYIFKYANEIRFVKGRLAFENGQESGANAPFPSAVIVFDLRNKVEKVEVRTMSRSIKEETQ